MTQMIKVMIELTASFASVTRASLSSGEMTLMFEVRETWHSTMRLIMTQMRKVMIELTTSSASVRSMSVIISLPASVVSVII